MSVNHEDDAGRRSVAMTFELPGTPEQVWEAIATGPGISSWFVPTEVDTRVGGAVAFHLGPDMTSTGQVTAWEPPRRFAYEEPGWNGEAPPLASEFIVEAQAGGTCTVRIVHSLFTSADDWDDQLDGMKAGWGAFFAVLRVYLRHFAGLRCASLRPTGLCAGSHDDARAALKQALGLAGAAAGERVDNSGGDRPLLAGIVERIGENAHNSELLLRLERPAPGAALIGTYVWDGTVHIAISLYFYGEGAEAVLAREAPRWQAWIERHFAPPAPTAA